MDTSIEYLVYGKYALFTDPLNRTGGEKFSYSVPTYGALAAITDNIYWKPTIKWVIDNVRVMKKITWHGKGVRVPDYNDTRKCGLSIYTYLYDVAYQVRAHFIWNMMRPDMEKDRIYKKHMETVIRRLKNGCGGTPFLGTRECPAFIEPCVFGTGEGYYDNSGVMPLGMMVHSAFSSEADRDCPDVKLWSPVMTDGVIHFIRPEEAISVKRFVPVAKERKGGGR